MIRVGLTGGIATGKSEVAKILKAKGYPVLDADGIAKELYGDPKILAKIEGLTNQRLKKSDGRPDKEKIMAWMFRNDRNKRALEKLIHPLVMKEIEKKICELKKQGNRIVFIESAILFEIGYNKFVDVAVTIDCSEEIQLARIQKKYPAEVASKLKAREFQWPLGQKRSVADHVVVNRGTIKELKSKVEKLLKVICAQTWPS